MKSRVLYMTSSSILLLFLFGIYHLATSFPHDELSSDTTTIMGSFVSKFTPHENPQGGTVEPNNLDMWPSNVKIFHPTDNMKDIQKAIAETQDPQKPYIDPITHKDQLTFTSANHFSSDHYALLFAPGEYKDCPFEVGYYVQVAGLGASATDVLFTGTQSGPFIPALNKDLPVTDGGTIASAGSGLSLDTFWRAGENFATRTTGEKAMLWSVSQAAPLRRVHIGGDLNLVDGRGYASGGVLANAVVEGTADFGGQQQWLSRNVDFQGDVKGGSWNLVFSGCAGGRLPDHGISNERSVVIEERPSVRAEKPFVVLNENDKFELHVPFSTREEVTGAQLTAGQAEVRDFCRVKLGIPRPDGKDVDDIELYNALDDVDEKITNELQAALDDGKDLVLCPGTIFLTKPLVVKHPDQVILGLGLATLVAPQDGSPCIRVAANTPGVRIAGIMLEASVQKKRNADNMNSDGVMSLLDWGEPFVKDLGDPDNPGVLTDVFARVGGANLNRYVSTDVMIRIHSSNVVGDNLWLWRADHTKLAEGEAPNDPNFPYYHQTREGECVVKTALEVHGDNVHIYGLFAEHTVEHQTIWRGEGGNVSFYQCELPYDVSNENFGVKGFVGYLVDKKVKKHKARGVGVYSNFTQQRNRVATAIAHPENSGVHFQFPFIVFLANLGMIESVVNGKGGHASEPGVPSRPE